MTVDTAELRRLLEAATPGPWRFLNPDQPWQGIVADANNVTGMVWDGGRNDYQTEANDDAALIVACVNALPVLLDRLETLEAERKIGPMPHKCLNDECGTMSYGTGYDACPSCGDTSGRDAEQT